MKTLTSIQQQAVQDILGLRVQTPRASSFGLTFLNRSRRGLTRIFKQFIKDAEKLGFNEVQIAGLWKDIKDMAALEEGATE